MTPASRQILWQDLRATAHGSILFALIIVAGSWFGVLLFGIVGFLPYQVQTTFFTPAWTAQWRVRALLPVVEAELDRVRWWVVIGFPGLVLSLGGALIVPMQRLLEGQGIHLGGHAMTLPVAMGFVLWMWSGLGIGAASNLWLGQGSWRALWATVISLLLGMALLLVEAASPDEALHRVAFPIVVAPGLLAAIHLYLRPTQLVRGREPRRRKTERPSPASPGPFPVSGASGWAALVRPLGWRLLVLTLFIAAQAAVFAMAFSNPLIARRLPFDGEVMLLLGAMVGFSLGSVMMARALPSALRVLMALPLTAAALAARLVVLALAPAALVLLPILVADGVLRAHEAASFIGFLPILFAMFSLQAFGAAAPSARRPSLPLLPNLGLLLTPALVPFTTRPPLIALPPSVTATLALSAPVWGAIAVAAAIAMIAAAYRRTLGILRERPPQRPDLMLTGGIR
jgi:hypothetical protein